MSKVEDIKITSQTGIDSLKQIRAGLPSMKLRAADSRGNREYEMVKSLGTIVTRLLGEMKLGNEWGYTIWHISNRITIRNGTGPGYLIPINVKGSAHLDSEETQQFGWYSYYDGVTDLTPELDCIFVAQNKS